MSRKELLHHIATKYTAELQMAQIQPTDESTTLLYVLNDAEWNGGSVEVAEREAQQLIRDRCAALGIAPPLFDSSQPAGEADALPVAVEAEEGTHVSE